MSAALGCTGSQATTPPSADAGTTAVAAPPKAQLERDAHSGVELVYQSEAVAVVAIPGRVVVLEPDFRFMHGVEPGSGEVLWRRQIQSDPRGAHTLHSDRFRVLVHAGESLIVVDARDGRILGRSDEAPPPEELEVAIRGGVCAYEGPCGVALFDCTAGARRGGYIPARSFERSEESVECPAPPRVLGGAHDDVILRRGPAGPATEVVAVDPQGETRWSIALAMAPTLEGGVVDELDACWVWDETAVAVLRCSNGQVQWRAPLDFAAEAVSVHEGRLVASGRDGRRPVIAAWDLASGQPDWRRRLRRRRVALMADDSEGPWRAETSRVYEILAPQTGESIGRMAAGRDETLWRDVDGGYLRTNGDFEELSARGELERQRPYTGGQVLAIGATHVVSRLGTDLLFHDRIALRERARLVGDFELDPTSGALGAHRVLLRRAEPGGAMTVLVLGLEPRRRRAPG